MYREHFTRLRIRLHRVAIPKAVLYRAASLGGLHLSDMGRRFGGREGDCPVTEWLSDRLLRLPLFPDLADADQARVIEAVKSFALPSRTRRTTMVKDAA